MPPRLVYREFELTDKGFLQFFIDLEVWEDKEGEVFVSATCKSYLKHFDVVGARIIHLSMGPNK